MVVASANAFQFDDVNSPYALGNLFDYFFFFHLFTQYYLYMFHQKNAMAVDSLRREH
jgi:hypothetical protein